MSNPGTADISVAIPTYRREHVLLETLQYLLALQPPPAEILVLDQTGQHEPETTTTLQHLADTNRIRWIQLTEPSIPKAMNQGLLLATQQIVLFVDDDIRPEPGLLTAHLAAHAEQGDVIVAGRVIQPWEEGESEGALSTGSFAHSGERATHDFIGCNFSVSRAPARSLGGFDENFVRVAYRFEAEFAHRWRASGKRIRFAPDACLHHLKDVAGGTRSYGDHLTTWRPDHAVGAYYFCLRTGAWRVLFTRPLRAVATRHHLRHPWQIVGTLWAELRGLAWALRLHLGGPRLRSAAEGSGT